MSDMPVLRGAGARKAQDVTPTAGHHRSRPVPAVGGVAFNVPFDGYGRAVVGHTLGRKPVAFFAQARATAQSPSVRISPAFPQEASYDRVTVFAKVFFAGAWVPYQGLLTEVEWIAC